MDPFIIITPPYIRNSNGIKTLHKICHTINGLGGDARILFVADTDPNTQELVFGDTRFTNPEFNTPALQAKDSNLLNSAYIIYPETILGNPLQSQKVIRYLGNREGYCNGKKIGIQPTDFLLAHSLKVREDANFILFNAEINPAFHSRDSRPALERPLDVTYVGKGYQYGETAIMNGTLTVSRHWPESQEQLAILLRQTRYFYTWDAWTATNIEAVLCGAVPIILRYDPWTTQDIDSSELPFPRMDLKNTNLDYEEFLRGKTALEDRLKTISTGWVQNVRSFMDASQAHFNKVNMTKATA